MDMLVFDYDPLTGEMTLVHDFDPSQPPDHELLDPPESKALWRRTFQMCIDLKLTPMEAHHEANRKVLGPKHCGTF